jgi:hypothetical protein
MRRATAAAAILHLAATSVAARAVPIAFDTGSAVSSRSMAATAAAAPAAAARKVSKAGYDVTPLPRASVEALAAKLDPETRHIVRGCGAAVG